MKRVTFRFTSSLLVLSLALLFLVIEPTHNHEDNQSHSDCPICMIAKQPGSITLHFALPALVYTHYTRVPLPVSRDTFTEPIQTKSRSPPIS